MTKEIFKPRMHNFTLRTEHITQRPRARSGWASMTYLVRHHNLTKIFLFGKISHVNFLLQAKRYHYLSMNSLLVPHDQRLGRWKKTFLTFRLRDTSCTVAFRAQGLNIKEQSMVLHLELMFLIFFYLYIVNFIIFFICYILMF